MIPTGFQRVSKRRPCPICGKPDWCLIARDGSKAICPRVQSSTPAGECGFVHSLDGKPVGSIIHREEKPVQIDAEAIHHRYHEAIGWQELESISTSLGVSRASLWKLGIGRAVEWTEGTYSFPMFDELGRAIGIRLRNIEGHKWSVYGSRNGLFFNRDESIPSLVFVCEGPTSAAALMDLGFWAVGRPSNSAGNELLASMIRPTRPHVVIVSEMDGKGTCDRCESNYCLMCHPGQVGAERAADAIVGSAKSVRIIEPMVGKDARDWKKAGATSETVLALVDNIPAWTRTNGRIKQ